MMMIPMMYDVNTMPIMMSPSPNMNLNQMQKLMAAGNMNQNQFMMMMPPTQGGMNNGENNNIEIKAENQQ